MEITLERLKRCSVCIEYDDRMMNHLMEIQFSVDGDFLLSWWSDEDCMIFNTKKNNEKVVESFLATLGLKVKKFI